MPQELTNAQGQVIWQASYKTWGSTVAEEWEVKTLAGNPVHKLDEGDSPAKADQQQNLRFQGQYLDRDTGLHYNTFRYYDPDVGRFICPDPIGLAGGINLGSYSPNPLMWIDPWGWSCESSINRRTNQVKSKGYQDHHIASDKHSRTKDHELFDLAGISQQSRKNKILLPEDAATHPDRSIHKGRHKSEVSEKMGDKMDDIVIKGKTEGWSQKQYEAAPREVLAKERDALRNGQRALNKNKRPGSTFY